MQRPPPSRGPKRKAASIKPGGASEAAFQDTQQTPEDNSASPNPASAQENLIASLGRSCAKFGRHLSSLDGESFTISGIGQALDLRAAATVIRRMEVGA